MSERIFTLQEARELLPQITAITEAAAERVDPLLEMMENLPEDHPKRADVEEKAQEILNQWAQEITALGPHAKGLWLVDFDNGSGYYCWKYPETTLDHFHDYDAGFRGRMQIQ